MNKNESYVDVYFDPQYGALNELIEGGESVTYRFESNKGVILNTFIKRKIHKKVNNIQYYDITTPYGYGGPIITKLKGDKKSLLEEYSKDFNDYCKQNNIVSEFIRFHPIQKNYEDFKTIYEVVFNRKTICTNLEKYENPFLEEFSKSARRTTNRSIRSGVSYKIVEEINKEDILKFYNIYIDTMKRIEGDDFYFFPIEYFEKLTETFNEKLLIINALYDDEIIASELYFVYEGYIHAHLSGTKSNMLNLSPSNVINYAITLWGKENGMKLIHHGGGLSGDENDSLYKFKQRFGKNSDYSFYIGKKIWNHEIYEELVILTNNEENDDYFPQYRKRM